MATPEYAPAGVFYLLVSAHKETKDGISRLLPGTEVRLLRPGFYRTPIGDVALDSKLLTRDLAQARTAREVDAARQAAAYARIPIPTPYAPVSPYQQNPVAAVPAEPVASSVADADIRTLHFKIDSLRREIETLQSRATYLFGKSQRVLSAGTYSTSTASSDYAETYRKIDKAQAELDSLQAQLKDALRRQGGMTTDSRN